MFSQAKRGKRDPVGFLTPSTVGRGRSRAVCSFQKRRWLCSATDSTAASIPLPFTRAKTYKLNAGSTDRPCVRACHASPSFLPSFFGPFQLFLGPRKGYLSGAQWEEELLPAPLTRTGMNDSQWAPLWPGKGDRPHRTSSPRRRTRLLRLVAVAVAGAEREHHCKQQRIEITRGKRRLLAAQ